MIQEFGLIFYHQIKLQRNQYAKLVRNHLPLVVESKFDLNRVNQLAYVYFKLKQNLIWLVSYNTGILIVVWRFIMLKTEKLNIINSQIYK